MRQFVCLIAAALLLSLCGCMESVQLSGRAIVEAVAIDRTAGGYTVTLQLSGVAESGRDSGGIQVAAETGGTLTEAFTKAAVTQGKQIFMGNCSLLLIGETTARGGIDEILRYFNAIHRVNSAINIALTRADAGAVLRAQKQNPLLSAGGITDQLDGAWQGGFSVRGRLIDVVNALQSGQTAACLPLLTLETGAEIPTLKIVGAGVFRGEYLDQTINPAAVRGYAWTQNSIKSTALVVDDDRFGQFSAVTDAQRATISVEEVGDLLVFEIDLTVHGAVVEQTLTDGGAQDQAETAVMLQERQIRAEIEQMLDETQRQGYDLLGLSLLVRQRFPAFYEAHRADWGEVIRTSGYNAQVRCVLRPLPGVAVS